LELNWRQKAAARAQLKLAIEDALDTGLPRAYTPEFYQLSLPGQEQPADKPPRKASRKTVKPHKQPFPRSVAACNAAAIY